MRESINPTSDGVLPVDYGRGRGRRRTSRLALASFLLPLPAWVLAVLTLMLWRAKPPPLSGFEGVGWFFGMAAVFGALVVTTIVVAPLSLALGVAGLAVVRASPDRLRGRLLARVGILLSLGISLLVAVAKYRVERVDEPTPAMAAKRAEADRQYAEIATANRLVYACARYADKYGVFPPDDPALYDWVASAERGLERTLPDYIYCGAGIVNDDPYVKETPAQIHDNNTLIVFVSRSPTAGQRLVAFKGNLHMANAMFLPEDYLPRAFADSNEVRSKLNLPPVDFNRLLAPPATRPAATPAP